MKASADEFAMHQRVLSGEPVARAEVIAALYEDIVRGVQHRGGADCDTALAEEQASESLLRYADDPSLYNPQRASLRSYLVMVGYWRYLDELKRDRRHGGGLPSLSDARIAASAERAAEDAGEDAIERLIAQLDSAQLRDRLLAQFEKQEDQTVAAMVLDGIGGWEPYVEALGLQSLSPDQQRKGAYRVKNRVEKRLRRLGGAFNERR